jgi:adenylate kinase
MNKYRALLLIGAPGSGKGTQGKTLGMLPGFYHCSCGEVFRSIDVRTDLGRIFLECSSNGLLVPDEASIQLWNARIRDCEKNRAFKPELDYLVLDGIPRNAEQARLMESIVEVKIVFHLQCSSPVELAARLRKRALKDNRLDDASDAVIQRRLEVYEQESKALLAHYSPALIHHLDALRPPHVVLSDILSHIIQSSEPSSMAHAVIGAIHK